MAQFGKVTTHIRLDETVVNKVRTIVEKLHDGTTIGSWFEKAAEEKMNRDNPKKKKV